jgi:hypothetical protein
LSTVLALIQLDATGLSSEPTDCVAFISCAGKSRSRVL